MERDTNEATIFQWLLELPPLQEVLNWPIQVNLLSAAGIDVHMVSKAEPADPDAVAEAWNKLCGAVGPFVMLHVMGSGHWQNLVPKVEGNVISKPAKVWRGEGKCVVAHRITDENGKAINVEFKVEDDSNG